MPSKTIEIPAHGYSNHGQSEPERSMFICGDTLAGIWDHSFPHGSEWTVCLQKRTPKGRRPYKEAIKLDIPHNFGSQGVTYETRSGYMSEGKLLVHESDSIIRDRNLDDGKYWCWVEVSEG